MKRWLPEIGLLALLCFFALRDLGTFPAPWADEGLFMIVAKRIAAGEGYTLPFLATEWAYPYFLNVGPTLIFPSALSIKLFGLSAAVARLPMALYLMAATAALYTFTQSISGRSAARWATLLLVTFSAYINTGKPVLGEIPGFFFLMLGLLALQKGDSWKTRLGAGAAFGLAIVTKITYGLILPSLGLAWLWSIWKKDWKTWKQTTMIIITSLVFFLPWRVIEVLHSIAGGLGAEFQNQVIGDGQSMLLHVLREDPHVLIRLPFLTFAVLFLFAAIGFWKMRSHLTPTLRIMIPALVFGFLFYYLSSPGWYRFLLPGHLLLLPFVPAGVERLLGKKFGSALMICIALAQGHWQLTYRGSTRGDEAAQSAAFVMENFADRDIFIEQTEVFALLPENPHWKFLMPNLSFSLPEEFSTVRGELCQVPRLRKLGNGEWRDSPLDLTQIAANYFLIEPPYPCPYVSQ